MRLDVVIPLRDRPEIELSVRALRETTLVDRVIVVDAGSQCADTIAATGRLAANGFCEVVELPLSRFSRARLANTGLRAATSGLVLVTDCDILWSHDQVAALAHFAARGCLVHVASVTETVPPAQTQPEHTRYRSSVQFESDAWAVTIEIDADSGSRPGTGLVCAQRAVWDIIGGYHECFEGWGWEDQDLLVRAQLLRVSVCAAGSVVHLSHGDEVRDLGGRTKADMRDLNIARSLALLAEGDWHGPIAARRERSIAQRLVVSLPAKLLEKQEIQRLARFPGGGLLNLSPMASE